MNNNNNNNIIYKLKPKKILGKGTEGIAIHTNNNKYVVKIYSLEYRHNELLLRILDYLQTTKNLPKTIYITYYFTKKVNSLNRYISDNSLPEHFSVQNSNNFEVLASKYKFNQKLYEIMKYYKYSFTNFIEILKNNKNITDQNKINILYSLFQQGLMTIFWLYMKKGIIHDDFNYDNFYVQKTKKSYIKFNINNYEYKIKLEGYYLIIADFGHAKSIEFVDFNKFPEKNTYTIVNGSMNPLYSIRDYVSLFKPKFRNNYSVYNIKINIAKDMVTNRKLIFLYKAMVKSYILGNSNLQSNIDEYKKYLFKHVNNKILKKFLNESN